MEKENRGGFGLLFFYAIFAFRGGYLLRIFICYAFGITMGGRLMADWQKIKTEYITTDTSYRKLAQKHGVHYNAIANRAKQEDWISQRNQYCDRTVTNTVTAISNKQVDRAAKLVSVADLLLDKVKSLVEDNPELLVSTQSIKNLSGVLKDIKEVQMIRSDADLREQEARIAKLRKEAEKEENDNRDVTIVIEGGDPSWQS